MFIEKSGIQREIVSCPWIWLADLFFRCGSLHRVLYFTDKLSDLSCSSSSTWHLGCASEVISLHLNCIDAHLLARIIFLMA